MKVENEPTLGLGGGQLAVPKVDETRKKARPAERRGLAELLTLKKMMMALTEG